VRSRGGIILLVVTPLLWGCDARQGDYVPASSISRKGFAKDAEAVRAANGREVKLWGFVDHGNLYGDEGARKVLQDLWAGDGPSRTTWRFDLKAGRGDAVGQGMPVHVPNDEGRDALLRRFVADARAHRPTRVFLEGKLFTFDAPTNVVRLEGLYMELRSSDDILLTPPG
jgi:hypothetical protein